MIFISAEDKKTLLGPAIVAGANAMRAFDAPIRYSLTLSRHDWGGSLSSAMRLSSFSSFIVLIEHLVGFILLAPILLYKRGMNHFKAVLTSLDRKEKLALLGVSMGSGLGLYFYLISFAMGNPTVAILVQKSQPLITLIVAMLLLKEKPSNKFYLAGGISLVGVILLAFKDLQNPQLFEIYAVLASLIAATFWGSNTVFGKILTKKADYWDLTWFRYIGGAVILIIFNAITLSYTSDNASGLTERFMTFAPLWEGAQAPLALNIELTGFQIILIATIFTGGILPLAIYYYGLKYSKAAIGGLAELAFPVLAIFVNYLFMGFELSGNQIGGAILILIATTWLMFINRNEVEAKPEDEAIKELNE
ncbi:MAG: EamA family transporter [Candidatus Heimdallarchaeota archaeon]|nr:EamA family transporter [Candidatus Heimdallarchaeota archaeon]